ncbi:lysophospholipid acyltransferase family protein [Novosphingobium terrae]|uniref:lysophospholipid acyltransferase family protein n=1 Tax=Novosphingobium terrae TaxID=2726189 RepID=UPI0019814D24|nr:lysophospholipid acyltransferase family protein [Novosphingobium terrae]
MSALRDRWRLARAALGFGALLVLAGPWLLLPKSSRLRRGLGVLAWRALLGGFGIRIEVHGKPMPGALIVANHVSWIDIPVFGRTVDAGFVAKDDVADWPLIGRLTAAYGCLFVSREARGKAGEQAGALAALLSHGRSLILFPEGTTGEGDACLPFRSSLFALIPPGTPVQPVTLRYYHADGSPLDAAERRAVSWIGDDELAPHALALAKSDGLLAKLWFDEPIPAGERKALTRACFDVIEGRLEESRK